ncbi:hypothetical protein H8B06_10100 [Sphingobacterium sp. DN00404]|uniref:Tail specific protease domain-containing protein n=1 Tax=Sphingobacterium micropteri TaxID=2763501 RepID=A0ABR7YPA9_9SPHI|nr:S41 family peptidase [Sphingobacterium micropteri]MBD1433178.1 hypothetical protein [Sphingobacterium micropteri]
MNLHKYLLLLLCLGLLFACKKEIKNPPNPEPEEPTEQERLRASIYDYFNKYSLWTTNIPDLDENGRLDFVKKYSSNQSLLTALKNMTPFYQFRTYETLNIAVGNRYDRYSYLYEPQGGGNASRAGGFRMDTNEGYGLHIFWGVVTEESVAWARPVVYFVEGGSPGHQAGVKRGAIVMEIDNKQTRVPVFKGEDDEYYLSDQPLANTIFRAWYDGVEKPTLALKLKLNGREDVVTKLPLERAAEYEIKPIIAHSVYTYSEKNIGYFAYSSFEQTDDGTHIGNTNKEEIDVVFQTFGTANIKDLILDLRYNTGGYVDAAVYLANKIINRHGDGQLMFSYETNEYLARTQANSFKDVFFKKNNGTLELEKVFFLVTEQTASAAELLISVLKPYMEIELVGDQPRTYGKPVGFFGEDVGDDVELWAASFKTINNAKKEEDEKFRDYWDGLTVKGDNIAVDRISYDFGDREEDMIARALVLAGISPPSGLQASTRKNVSTQGGIKIGIINKPRERNLLKTKD